MNERGSGSKSTSSEIFSRRPSITKAVFGHAGCVGPLSSEVQTDGAPALHSRGERPVPFDARRPAAAAEIEAGEGFAGRFETVFPGIDAHRAAHGQRLLLRGELEARVVERDQHVQRLVRERPIDEQIDGDALSEKRPRFAPDLHLLAVHSHFERKPAGGDRDVAARRLRHWRRQAARPQVDALDRRARGEIEKRDDHQAEKPDVGDRDL